MHLKAWGTLLLLDRHYLAQTHCRYGTSLLSPTNGTDTYSIGVNYVTESVDVAFGYAMSSFGDKAVTTAYGTGNFTNNDATTTGLRIKFKLP